MWRYLAGGTAALTMGGAGLLAFGGEPRSGAVLPSQPAVTAGARQESATTPERLPEASPRTREEKRFGRYDKDRDGSITRDEYFVSRRKAYARLDRDGDGRLDFDEWSAKTVAKFTTADRDKSGAMNATEFAATALKRKPARRAACPPARDEG